MPRKNNTWFPEGDLPPHLRLHLRSLRLDQNASAYLSWCRHNGFKPTIDKSTHALAAELALWQRRNGRRALARSRRLRDPTQLLIRACEGDLDVHAIPHALHAPIERIQSIEEPRQRTRLADLLASVGHGRFLLESCRFGDRSLPYLDGLIHLVSRRGDWIRPAHALRFRSKNRGRQFSALLRHLLVRYPVPTFLDAAWLRNDAAAHDMRDWFLHIGNGGNLRTARTPVPVTKRIAHHFMRAPADASVEQALRWGQVHALGGTSALARGVLASSLGTDLSHDHFWQSVLRFFVAHDDLRVQDVGPIVDYVRQQRFECLEIVRPDGSLVTQPPPKPHFSMRGRKLGTLLREVSRWHKELSRLTGGADVWKPSQIAGFEQRTGSPAKKNLKIWRIAELNTRKLLADEGRLLRHCVVSYSGICRAGRSSIWSLTVEREGTIRRLQTIQVTASGTIIQSRGYCNALPTEQVKGILRRWASREGLSINCFV